MDLLTTLVLCILSFSLAMAIRRPKPCAACLQREETAKALTDGVPTSLQQLLAGFREYIIATDGTVSTEAEEAMKALAEVKRLPAPPEPNWLQGEACEQYQDELEAAKTIEEHRAVVKRWHAKGFIFPLRLRKDLIKGACNEEGRTLYQRLFDEQDARLGK